MEEKVLAVDYKYTDDNDMRSSMVVCYKTGGKLDKLLEDMCYSDDCSKAIRAIDKYLAKYDIKDEDVVFYLADMVDSSDKELRKELLANDIELIGYTVLR